MLITSACLCGATCATVVTPPEPRTHTTHTHHHHHTRKYKRPKSLPILSALKSWFGAVKLKKRFFVSSFSVNRDCFSMLNLWSHSSFLSFIRFESRDCTSASGYVVFDHFKFVFSLLSAEIGCVFDRHYFHLFRRNVWPRAFLALFLLSWPLSYQLIRSDAVESTFKTRKQAENE